MRLAWRLNHGIADSVKNFAPIKGSQLCRRGNFRSVASEDAREGFSVGANPVKTKMELSVRVAAL
jgi:hypothetical protein